MIAWIKKLWKVDEPEVIEYVTIGPIDNPIVKPNNINYKFPDPTDFRPPKVKFRIRYKKRKKKKNTT